MEELEDMHRNIPWRVEKKILRIKEKIRFISRGYKTKFKGCQEMEINRDNIPVLTDIYFLIKSFCSWRSIMDEFNLYQNALL